MLWRWTYLWRSDSPIKSSWIAGIKPSFSAASRPSQPLRPPPRTRYQPWKQVFWIFISKLFAASLFFGCIIFFAEQKWAADLPSPAEFFDSGLHKIRKCSLTWPAFIYLSKCIFKNHTKLQKTLLSLEKSKNFVNEALICVLQIPACNLYF